MADESGADDGAIFDEWDRFTLDEVVMVFDRLERLYRAWVRLRGAEVPPALVAEARDLIDHRLKLTQLAWLHDVAGV